MDYTNKNGSIRFYDSSPTPYYLALAFEKGDFSGPLGAPKTEEILKLHRGNMDANAGYVEGSDEKIMEPQEITLTAILEDSGQAKYLLDLLFGNTVNSNTLITTKGDTQRDGANANPAFADSSKKTFNVEILFDGATDILFQYNEVLFLLEEQSISESGEEVTIALKGKVYGTIPSPGTAFTAGTDVTA